MFRPYRDRLLIEGERVALITRPHPFTFWLGAARGIVAGVVLLVLALLTEQGAIVPGSLVAIRPYLAGVLFIGCVLTSLTAVAAWTRWRMHEIVVTDRRVIRIAGIFSKEVIDYSLDAITDLRLRQSWLGRIFDYGDVDVLTASEAAVRPGETFPVVAHPITFTQTVQEQRERRRTAVRGI